MDTNLYQEKLKLSWATIMQAALDALLVQLPEEIQIDLSPAGLPTIEHLQDFVIIPLRGPLRDGDFVWALTLPTIRPTNTAPVPQDE